MKNLFGAAFLVFGFVLSPAWADDASGSNIGLTDYPGPACVKPQREDVVEPKMAMLYNVAVEAYNTCMRTYVENANGDMRRIQSKVKAAVAAANAP